jgi:hypothetical protein
MAEPCPGSCNRRAREVTALHREALARYDDALEAAADGDPVPDVPERPEVRWWPGEPVWCGRCTAKIRSRLAELDELASSLANLPPGVRPASRHRDHVKVATSRAHKSPAPAGDDLGYLEWWLLSWESAYRELKGWDSPPPRGVMSSVITASAQWISTRLDQVLQCGFAYDFGVEAILLHNRLKAVANAAAEYQHVTDPCPRCKRYLLFQRAGEPYIVCHYEPSAGDQCGLHLTREELDHRLGRATA